MASARRKSFPPAARADAKLLILGSMPGEESLRQQRYYAYPQNAFWPVMGRLLGFPPAMPYEERLAALMEAHVALWAVLESCLRPGSMDSKIRSEKPNDFKSLFKKCPFIKRIVFNGSTAEKLFKRHALAFVPPDCQLIKAPSTSPAFASLGFEGKLALWRQALLPELVEMKAP